MSGKLKSFEEGVKSMKRRQFDNADWAGMDDAQKHQAYDACAPEWEGEGVAENPFAGGGMAGQTKSGPPATDSAVALSTIGATCPFLPTVKCAKKLTGGDGEGSTAAAPQDKCVLYALGSFANAWRSAVAEAAKRV
jgi:hypothetical protein